MGKSLVQIIADAGRLTQMLIDSGGEVTEELHQELTINEKDLVLKCDAYAAVLERLKIEKEYWKGMSDQCLKVARGCDSTTKFLKNNIKYALERLNQHDVTGEVWRFNLSDSKPSLKVDVTELPEEYFIVTQVREPDREKITEVLKDGKQVSGASLESGKTLRKYKAKRG